MTSEPVITSLEDGGGASTLALSWDKRTVPLEAVERALYAMADQVTGSVVDEGEVWSLTAHRREARADLGSLAHRLRQEVNDQTLRIRIAERTDPIRNLVFALAFSKSGLVGGSSAEEPSADTAAGNGQPSPGRAG